MYCKFQINSEGDNSNVFLCKGSSTCNSIRIEKQNKHIIRQIYLQSEIGRVCASINLIYPCKTTDKQVD